MFMPMFQYDNICDFSILYCYFHFCVYKIHIIFSDVNSVRNIRNIYFIKSGFFYRLFIICNIL